MINGVIRLIDKPQLKVDLWIQVLTYKRQYWNLDLFSISLTNPFFTKKDWWSFNITFLGIGLNIQKL